LQYLIQEEKLATTYHITCLIFWWLCSHDSESAWDLEQFQNQTNLTFRHVWHGYGPKVGYEHLHWSKLLSTITNCETTCLTFFIPTNRFQRSCKIESAWDIHGSYPLLDG
jgi:hypothetical protein